MCNRGPYACNVVAWALCTDLCIEHGFACRSETDPINGFLQSKDMGRLVWTKENRTCGWIMKYN